jgi:hypothetical protein
MYFYPTLTLGVSEIDCNGLLSDFDRLVAVEISWRFLSH